MIMFEITIFPRVDSSLKKWRTRKRVSDQSPHLVYSNLNRLKKEVSQRLT